MNITEILTTYIKDQRLLDYYLGAEAETVRTTAGRIINSPSTFIQNDTFVMVSFSKQEVLDGEATKKAGKPVYIVSDMITTRIPAGPEYSHPRISHNRVKAKHIFRFPKEFHAYKSGVAGQDTGTPLDVLNVPEEIAHTLRSYGYTSVERLATADLSLLKKIPTLTTFKSHAEEYLRNKPTADVEKKIAAQDETIKKLTEQLTIVTDLLKQTAGEQNKKASRAKASEDAE